MRVLGGFFKSMGGQYMRQWIMWVLVAFCMSGCDQPVPVRPVHQCGAYMVDIQPAADGETITAVINGDAVTLGRAVSASGAKYDGVLNDIPVTLWSKGDEWILILDDDQITPCDVK